MVETVAPPRATYCFSGQLGVGVEAEVGKQSSDEAEEGQKR